jgi:hypothetical protein
MKARLLFGAGILTVYEMATLWSLFLDFSVRPDLFVPATIAIYLAVPLFSAALATAAYSFGVRAFNRQPSPVTSYLVGLGCAGLVAGGYRLLESFYFPFGVYGGIVEPVFLCLVGLLGSLFAARRAEPVRSSNMWRRPLFQIGFGCCCGAFATLFPLVYCPCTGHEAWLWYVVLGGALVWLISALIGVVMATTSEQRALCVVALLTAPVAYWVMLSLGVSR